ncbi:hypothetical protein LINGRAHAP2_LOCUS8077 [Linum grandiflorum]
MDVKEIGASSSVFILRGGTN